MSAAAKAEKSPVPKELRGKEGNSGDQQVQPPAKEGSPGAEDTGTCPEGQENSQLASSYSSTGDTKLTVTGVWSLKANGPAGGIASGGNPHYSAAL